MKAKPYREINGSHVPCEPHEATHLYLHFPGPLPNRCVSVITRGSRKDTGNWTWNGDVEKPTLRPSVRTKGVRHLTDDEIKSINNGVKLNLPEITCHSWVTDGRVEFLNDSTHELAGQTLDLLEVMM